MMQPSNWEEQKEIKIPAQLYEMLEKRAKEEGRDTDTLIKYILLDALAPSVVEDGRQIGQQAEELGKKLIEAFSKSENTEPEESPELVN